MVKETIKLVGIDDDLRLYAVKRDEKPSFQLTDTSVVSNSCMKTNKYGELHDSFFNNNEVIGMATPTITKLAIQLAKSNTVDKAVISGIHNVISGNVTKFSIKRLQTGELEWDPPNLLRVIFELEDGKLKDDVIAEKEAERRAYMASVQPQVHEFATAGFNVSGHHYHLNPSDAERVVNVLNSLLWSSRGTNNLISPRNYSSFVRELERVQVIEDSSFRCYDVVVWDISVKRYKSEGILGMLFEDERDGNLILEATKVTRLK